MAKFGEGDERWIVQDRADGTNVNAWHWSEKDCTSWAKQKLSDQFKSLVLVDNASVNVSTTTIDSFSGEAFINIRKKKLVPSYELEVKVNFDAQVKDSGSIVKGKIHLPYIAEENHDEDPEVRVICDEVAGASKVRDAINSTGKQAIYAAVNAMIKDLQSGAAANQSSTSSSTSEPTRISSTSDKAKLSSAAPDEVRKAAAPKIKCRRTLKLTEKFRARAGDIYECFAVEGRVRAFTQSMATVQPKPDGEFSWFNGSLTGKFLELVPGKKLLMAWRFSTWEEGAFSKVELTFNEPEPGEVVVELNHTEIPEADKFGNEDVLDNVENGWKNNVFHRIRAVFGYGV